MNININHLKRDLIGTTVPVPTSGTLSGHAAGEPFDKHVYSLIKKSYPDQTYRQFEYLNKLYTDNPRSVTVADRFDLISPPSLSYLINRGKDVTKTWTKLRQFTEKQNDTADIVIVKDNFLNIIDVKTFSIEKHGQAPNIISAVKLAKMCSLMLESGIYNSLDITYLGITWKLEGKDLRCTEVSIKELFKVNPELLYINWAAAMQIQFHVESIDQSFTGTVEEWCRLYLRTFVRQAKARVIVMTNKFVTPFEKFLD